jgi:hypothetical protein
MRLTLNATAAAALLLAAIPAHNALFGARSVWPVSPPSQPAKPAAPLGRIGRMALERCVEHVEIIHDVHWAAACMLNAKEEQARQAACLRAQLTAPAGSVPDACVATVEPPDDSAECTLPPARAAMLEAGRQAAQGRCRTEAFELERMAEGSHPAR